METRLISYGEEKNGVFFINNGFSWTRKLFSGSPYVLLDAEEPPTHGDVVSTHSKPTKIVSGVVYGGPWSSPAEGTGELSGLWDYKGFDSLPKGSSIAISCSIGIGCVWNGCRYCMNKHLGLGFRMRPGWDKTLCTDLTSGRHDIAELDLCMAGPPGAALSRLVQIRGEIHAHQVVTFARAPDLTPAIQSGKRMDKILFLIGLEAYSNKSLRILHRGMTIEKVFDTVSRVMDSGASVVLMMMDKMKCETDDDVATVKERIAQIGCSVSENGPLMTDHLKQEDAVALANDINCTL